MSYGVTQIRGHWDRMPPKDFVLGLDLGQASDYSALVVLEQVTALSDDGGWIASYLAEPRFDVSQIKRFPLGAPYPVQVRYVKEVVNTLKAIRPEPKVDLVVDRTGVGRAVADLLLEADLDCGIELITISGGDTVSHTSGSREWVVPKRDLAAAVLVPLQNKQLEFAESLELASTLRNELTGFKVKVSLKTGHESFAAGEDWRRTGSKHDDLVLALALATWWVQNRGGGWNDGLMAGFADWAAEMGV